MQERLSGKADSDHTGRTSDPAAPPRQPRRPASRTATRTHHLRNYVSAATGNYVSVHTYFFPQHNLVSKVRRGAKVTKKCDRAQTGEGSAHPPLQNDQPGRRPTRDPGTDLPTARADHRQGRGPRQTDAAEAGIPHLRQRLGLCGHLDTCNGETKRESGA